MYHVLYTDGGTLVGVTTDDVTPIPTVSVIDFEGDAPDLNKVKWDRDRLVFVSNSIKYTRYEFLTKFTSEERISIRNSNDDTVKDFISLVEVTDFEDVTDDDIIAAVQYLVSVNLLTNDRATEILS